jgi:hypothetical protein
MDSTGPNWYCPQCGTHYEKRTKYCSQCDTHPMLRFLCTATGEDDLYSNYTARHLPHCRTCAHYQNLLDITTANTRRERTAALATTTNGILHTLSLLIAYIIVLCYSFSVLTCACIRLYYAVLQCII